MAADCHWARALRRAFGPIGRRTVEARQLIEGWEYERRGGRPERKIPPLQFSLKTMFIVTTVCAVACTFFGLVRDEPWLGLPPLR